jgi:uncharacterized protein YdhG (YjbR/CyaY superfamily)
MNRSAEVDAYIAAFPKEIAARLSRVRRAIRAAAPKAAEGISYRIPAYRQNGILVYFAGFRHHIGLFPPVRDPAIAKAAKKYAGPKGNLQLPHAEPLPLPLITRIVRFQVKQDSACAAKAKEKRGS